MGDALQWDHRPVVDVVWDRMPATLQLTAISMVFSLIVGVIVGAVAAASPDSVLDRVGRVLAITGQSMPIFWVGLLMIILFSVQLGWLDSAGGFSRLGPKAIIMPALSLSFFLVASHMRIVRSTMLEVLESDYIKNGPRQGPAQQARDLEARIQERFNPGIHPVFREFCRPYWRGRGN